jgi:sugar O-acyltransferase (sialic acid O-acetyltransferase NeuD family)
MKEVLLIGGGGHCLSVIDSIESSNEFKITGIIDIDEKVGKKVGKYEVIGTDDDLEKFHNEGIKYAFITLASIGDVSHRLKLVKICKAHGFSLPTIIDSTAIIASSAIIQEGTFVGKGAIVNSESFVGENAIINTGSIIEHNSEIGDFSHIAPGVTLAGNVRVGNSTHLGIGSTVIQNIHIGNDVLIGSHSNVVSDITHNTKAFGNPCKVVSEK